MFSLLHKGRRVFDTFYKVAMLAAESQQVVALRLWTLAGGGAAAQAEAYRMVSEKVTAGAQAAGRLLSGASPDSVVDDYRRAVQANMRRLSDRA